MSPFGLLLRVGTPAGLATCKALTSNIWVVKSVFAEDRNNINGSYKVLLGCLLRGVRQLLWVVAVK